MFEKPTNDSDAYVPTEADFVKAEEMLKDPVLAADQYAREMIDNGCFAPDGTQLNPVAFLEYRKALLESGENDVPRRPLNAEEMVQPSKSPEMERGSTAQWPS